MAGVRQPKIIATHVWGAKRATARPVVTGRPKRIIFHHTDGHHPEIENPQSESRAEAMAFARSIQDFHMGPTRRFNDSGHNFLVCMNGDILVGRHLSYTAVRAGRMVVSAHCPGQNDQPGIEHEHRGEPHMTAKQLEASARLHAWIMSRCGIPVSEVFGHGSVALPGEGTECPAQLKGDIAKVKARAKQILEAEGRNPATAAQGTAFATAPH
jgi:N-acetylmuramoyl-L-alanine amidase